MQSAFAHPTSPLTPSIRRPLFRPLMCATTPPPPPPASPSNIAVGHNARRLAKWLAADWGNKPQAMESPQFWAHIHVCFRPLPWSLLQGYSFYCESAYDHNLGAPYKTSVVLIVNDENSNLELASFKLKTPEEYWMGAYEPQLLQPLTVDQLIPLPDACNTVYKWNQQQNKYRAFSRPGKACRINRAGHEKETYLESNIILTRDAYVAWDLGRDPQTDERIWGTAAGPFIFEPLIRLDHLVPDEVATVLSSTSSS